MPQAEEIKYMYVCKPGKRGLSQEPGEVNKKHLQIS